MNLRRYVIHTVLLAMVIAAVNINCTCTIVDNTTTTCPTTTMACGTTYNITSRILNGDNGMAIANADVYLISGYYDSTLASPATLAAVDASSDSNGNVTLSPTIPVSANYTIYIQAAGMYDVWTNIVITNTVVCPRYEPPIVMVPTGISGANIRAVLSWNKVACADTDLDLHGTAPSLTDPINSKYKGDSTDLRNHVHFLNKTSSNMTLDHDDKVGPGPETITFTDFSLEGEYVLSVASFAEMDISSANPHTSNAGDILGRSNAVVRIYTGGGYFGEKRVPTGDFGNVWSVCTITKDASGGLAVQWEQYDHTNDPTDGTIFNIQ